MIIGNNFRISPALEQKEEATPNNLLITGLSGIMSQILVDYTNYADFRSGKPPLWRVFAFLAALSD